MSRSFSPLSIHLLPSPFHCNSWDGQVWRRNLPVHGDLSWLAFLRSSQTFFPLWRRVVSERFPDDCFPSKSHGVSICSCSARPADLKFMARFVLAVHIYLFSYLTFSFIPSKCVDPTCQTGMAAAVQLSVLTVYFCRPTGSTIFSFRYFFCMRTPSAHFHVV